MPAKAYFIYDILIQIVVFDFLPITEMIDFKFQKTDPMNERFVWLGYDSTNFIEQLGSILIFLIYMVIKGVLVGIVSFIHCSSKYATLNNFLNSQAFKQSTVRFFLETLFELVICALLSFRMLELKSIWRGRDLLAFIAAMLTLTLSVIFMAFIIKFLVFQLRNVS